MNSEKSTKVGRVIEEYDLRDMGADLERRWTGRDGERESLRELADVFNRRVLEKSMIDAGSAPIRGEVDNYYRLLTDEDVTSGTRTEAKSRLREAGVDVDALEDDFVSYQAVRTYLQDVRRASYSGSGPTSVEDARDRFGKLVGRNETIVQDTLRSLRDAGEIRLGRFRVRTDIAIYCEDCETQSDAIELLRQGGCNCTRSRSAGAPE